MRNYERIELYLNTLVADIYPQPEIQGEHPALAKIAIDKWASRLTDCKNVLDVGCGEGFAQPMFEARGIQYEGVCLGEDYLVAREKGRNVKKMDFSFLEYSDNSFSLIFARHALEHSPMPILTLFEWARVSRQWLGLIMPHPEFYTYRGLNHYSVFEHDQITGLLDRAGWRILWDELGYIPVKDKRTEDNPHGLTVHEFQLFCEKKI